MTPDVRRLQELCQWAGVTWNPGLYANAGAILEIAEEVFRGGYKEGVRDYAVWKNGEQLVGVTQRPLADVMREVDEKPVTLF